MMFSGLSTVPGAVLKLMGAYLVFAFTGFVMILLFLEKIGAKATTDKPCLQVLCVCQTNKLDSSVCLCYALLHLS